MLNKILIGTCAIVLAASAAQAAYVPNAAGGKIVVTPMPCVAPELSPESRAASRHIYSYTVHGDALFGCYFVDAPNVHIYWYWPHVKSTSIPLNLFRAR